MRKMQPQGLPARNRTHVLRITGTLLYHWATEAVADNLGASSVYIYIYQWDGNAGDFEKNFEKNEKLI